MATAMFYKNTIAFACVAAGLFYTSARGAETGSLPDHFQNLQRVPDTVLVVTETGTFALTPNRPGEWQASGITVFDRKKRDGLQVELSAPNAAVKAIQLEWVAKLPASWNYLGDAWERAYGDLEWKPADPTRVMPWYFLASDGMVTDGYGVKTGAAALCFWTVRSNRIVLDADVRCGGSGVQLGSRTLDVCTVVTRCGDTNETPFAAARAFCRQMSPRPHIPEQPVYGFNDWYCTYGSDTADKFLADVRGLTQLATNTVNRPFAVVDDGWELTAGDVNPWTGVNTHFSRTLTMPQFADSIRAMGARPGLWYRPLLADASQPAGWRLSRDSHYLDPSVPAVRAHVKRTISQFRKWGYEMIKHDFSTYDLLGHWGFEMGAQPTADGWAFADRSRTTAEIIRQFYQDIRDAAGNHVLVEGCDTIGHLTAGIFELQRIGDDTSGREWDRTRKMGVNSLAFRAAQQGAFFVADADCVGQADPTTVTWDKNSQWLDLLARSGTGFFASFHFNKLTSEQRAAVSKAFAEASQPQPVAEPLDWMDHRTPGKWRLDGQDVLFAW